MDVRRLLKNAKQINAKRVIIECEGENLVINNPQIVFMNLMGQEVYQIVGKAVKEKKEVEISEEDVKLLMEKSGKSKEEVIKALKESNGDLAEALNKLIG